MLKQYTNSNWLREIKQTLKLNEIQKSVLIGTVLGDGYLRLSRSGKASRLQICHSASASSYVLWKSQIFRNWIFSEPRYVLANRSIRFTTISHFEFLAFYNLFYPRNIKTVPKNISNILKDPLSLAVWFMDDGNGYLRNSAFRISTYAFGFEGNLFLQATLLKNFGILTSLNRDSKGYQLYIPIKNGNAQRFKSLVEPYVLSTMRYKLMSISPVETYIEGTR